MVLYLLQLVTVEHLSAWLYYCMVVLHALRMYRLLKCKSIAVCVCVHAGVYVCAETYVSVLGLRHLFMYSMYLQCIILRVAVFVALLAPT